MPAGIDFSPNEVVDLKARLLDALYDGRANFLDDACVLIKLNYRTAWDWRRKDQDFAEALEDAMADVRERRLNRAERKLDENVEKGDNTAIIFFLKTIGRLRGYQERLQVDSTVTHTIDIDEAAKRIAFAMNAAIDRGEAIEGDYTEVIGALPPVLTPSEQHAKAAKDMEAAPILAKKRKAKKAKARAQRAKSKKP